MKKMELDKAIVELTNDGVMCIHIKPDSDVELRDAVLIVEAMGKLGNQKKYPVLIDAGEFSSVDKETRIFAASIESNNYTMADAIAYCNLAQQLMAQFYLKYNKPTVPTKVFADRDEAMTWLKTFK